MVATVAVVGVSEGDGPVDALANALKNGATLYSYARNEWRVTLLLLLLYRQTA
jgi:hypothetical protein